MGVNESKNETFYVAQLIGTKTAFNELIAYQKLSELIKKNLISVKLFF